MKDKKKGNLEIISFDDFFKGAKETKESKDLNEAANRAILTDEEIAEINYKNNRDWSILGGQVVGSEYK
jgi:hypothetical protein